MRESIYLFWFEHCTTFTCVKTTHVILTEKKDTGSVQLLVWCLVCLESVNFSDMYKNSTRLASGPGSSASSVIICWIYVYLGPFFSTKDLLHGGAGEGASEQSLKQPSSDNQWRILFLPPLQTMPLRKSRKSSRHGREEKGTVGWASGHDGLLSAHSWTQERHTLKFLSHHPDTDLEFA